MKTIRVLRSTGSNLPQFSEGQVVKVKDETADLLCRLNLAEVLEAVPEEPLTAVPPESDVQADSKPKPKSPKKSKPKE